MEKSTQSLSDKDVKAPNHKESHGMRDEINETTPLDNVKAPNLFERAKEEIEALVEAIHSKKDSQTNEARDQSTKAELNSKKAENNVKVPNLIEKAKEEIEAIMHHEKSPPRHHKETHGRSDDIDESTPIDEVKGPNVFQRAKEEIEALVEAIRPKKESSNLVSSPKKERGFRSSIGRGLEKVCSPWGNKKD